MRKVLIANRGEIARRIIRAAHQLGMATVAVYSDADADAVYVAEADEAVHLRGTAPAETYLAVPLLLDAVATTGADAVHPGYGFLSENADFAEACERAGLVFIGPPAAAIRLMGDKLGAKQIMAANGVPTLTSITAEATVDVDEVLSEIGLPVIVKASAGGGGRGMRIVTRTEELPGALDSARREAMSAFGDQTVFIERYVAPARHIEVQVFADRHGAVATLFERECSIQRRHQKLVEESPSPFVDGALRERLSSAATKAALAVDYVGAGTVEFVVGADRSFSFLEMNTRLQVEHPVTEMVTGVDLVALQFTVADGGHLPPEVLSPRLTGHAIEVRLCAEDPAAGHLPVAGTFDVFDLDEEMVRVDSGVVSSSAVPPYYDSMVAKVIAHAPTRERAAARLARALAGGRLHGVTTNRDLLVRVLRSPEFAAGETTTDFLERVGGLLDPLTGQDSHRIHAAVGALALIDGWRRSAAVQPAIPAGWRNNRSAPEAVRLGWGGQEHVVELDVSTPVADVRVDGEPVAVQVNSLEATGGGVEIDVDVEGIRRSYHVVSTADSVYVDSPLGASELTRIGRYPDPGDGTGPEGGLTASMPGRVVRVLVAAGETVAAGEPLLVLEAMKMEHTIASPVDGRVVAVAVAEGDQVERGSVLASVEP